jgi:hypothetical protein
MDQYAYIIDFCNSTRESRDRGRERESIVVDTLAKQIVALYRALQYASLNRYLWTRLLAPAPWFDFDVALLCGAVLMLPDERGTRISSAVVQAVPSDVSAYASEYLSTVRRLLQLER